MNGGKIPYLYITGASYSGSTLLAFLLNAHACMVSIGEQTRMVRERYPCSCGALLLQCPFFLELERQINALGSSFKLTDWQTLFHLSQHRWLNIFLVRPLRYTCQERIRDRFVPFWPGYRQAIRSVSQHVVHLAQAALAISGKEIFVDAQKDAIRIKFLQDIEQFDLKVVHLVRDVRGAVASYIKNTRNDDIALAVRKWSIANAESERAKRYVSPHQWLRLTYEELCTDPQGTVDCITDFIGVRRAPIPANVYDGVHHIIGNRMRLRSKSAGVVTLDESWKDRLTGRDLEKIARLGGAANRRYGHHWP